MGAAAEPSVTTAGTELPAIRVRAAGLHDDARWDEFVERCHQATFFHRAGWRHILEDVLHHRCHYLMAERGDVICGVLPLAEVKSRLFGHSLVSLPLCVYGGPAATDIDAEDALIDTAAELSRTLAVDHLELRNRTPKRAAWPHQDLYVSFRRTLFPDAEANLAAVPRKQRAMIRKAMGRDLAGTIDGTPERFFELYADNMHRHGSPPLSRRYFSALNDTFGDACETLIVSDSNGTPVSGVMSFYFRDEVLPYYAGDTDAARDLAANDFKYWDLMRRACGRGVRVFDYGRSKQGTGSYAFKKNWGFEPTPLAYEYQLLTRDVIPQNNPLNPRYRALISIWRRLPRPVVNAIGPMLARSLG